MQLLKSEGYGRVISWALEHLCRNQSYLHTHLLYNTPRFVLFPRAFRLFYINENYELANVRTFNYIV